MAHFRQYTFTQLQWTSVITDPTSSVRYNEGLLSYKINSDNIQWATRPRTF
jgi:hypothetical protein